MKKCTICSKPITVGLVVERECLENLQEKVDVYKQSKVREISNDKMDLEVSLEDALETYLISFGDEEAAVNGGANNVTILVNEILDRLWPEGENEDE